MEGHNVQSSKSPYRFQHDNMFTAKEESLLVPFWRKKFYNSRFLNKCRFGEGYLSKM
jgi:hypothetical protein